MRLPIQPDERSGVGDASSHRRPTRSNWPPPRSRGPSRQPGTRAANRRRLRRLRLTCTIAAIALIAGVSGGVTWYLHSVNSSVNRVDAFAGVPNASRPPRAREASNAQNLLVLGSDSRDPKSTAGSRSDTIILAHLPNDQRSVQMVSIPRDTWVHVPRSPDGRNGDTMSKINAAYAWGGLPLVVQTVESFTRIRIDHVVVIDFAGFKQIIDALGGVDIYVENTFTTYGSERLFSRGWHHMSGQVAFEYADERHAFSDGDFARIRHQQQMIKAVLDRAATAGLLTDPARMNAFLRATAKAVSVDQGLSIVDTAVHLRHLRSGDLMFATNPSTGTGMIGDQSVVLPDQAKDRVLFDAIRRDAVADIRAAMSSASGSTSRQSGPRSSWSPRPRPSSSPVARSG